MQNNFSGYYRPSNDVLTEIWRKCIFVLDTNVLLHNPSAIFMFAEHEIVIPLSVIEELDHFKKNNDDNGRNARQAIRRRSPSGRCGAGRRASCPSPSTIPS